MFWFLSLNCAFQNTLQFEPPISDHGQYVKNKILCVMYPEFGLEIHWIYDYGSWKYGITIKYGCIIWIQSTDLNSNIILLKRNREKEVDTKGYVSANCIYYGIHWFYQRIQMWILAQRSRVVFCSFDPDVHFVLLSKHANSSFDPDLCFNL